MLEMFFFALTCLSVFDHFVGLALKVLTHRFVAGILVLCTCLNGSAVHFVSLLRYSVARFPYTAANRSLEKLAPNLR